MNTLILLVIGMLVGSLVRSTRSIVWIGLGMAGFMLTGDVFLEAAAPYLGGDLNEVLTLIHTKVAVAM